MAQHRRNQSKRSHGIRRKSGKDALSLDLFSDSGGFDHDFPKLEWPDSSRFPINLDPRTTVAAVVQADLRAGRDRLLVAGYAGLEQLIDFVGSCADENPIRILFGSEPFPARRDSFELDGHDFSKEVENYWLEHGISLRLSAKVIRCIEAIRSGRLQARYLGKSRRRLHAKIYCTESAATVGSSNFTRPGLFSQMEANARFTTASDAVQHRDLRKIAENFWKMGTAYEESLLKLLEKLLRIVEWPEALARACAELLEGDWAQEYLKRDYLPQEGKLWPSQRQGIAQALYVLTRRGSVLIADAAGSGKTRMGIHLMGAVADHNIRIGRMRHGKTLMICPPLVKESWERESNLAGAHLDVHSHGVLSHDGSHKYEQTMEALHRAQILSVDEGHNFLTVTARRTQRLLRNMADYVIMFTATPLNKSVLDLLRIADILGADNLAPETLKMFRKLMSARNVNRTLEEPEIETLRREIKRFTIRRTKPLLNHLIKSNPDQYKDKNDKPCKYPEHEATIYPLHEPEEDRHLAREIRELCDQLYAVARFRKPIEMPEVLRGITTEEHYLKGRLSSARKIARYLVMKSLRSSRAALAEHLVGTKLAVQDFALTGFRKAFPSGNVINVLEKMAGKVPENKLDIELPDWLTDPAKHEEACRHDQAIYKKIHERVMRMSAAREKAKAHLLIDLVNKHDLVLAFDSRPISLAEIKKHIKSLDPSVNLVVATGDPGSEREQAMQIFALGSTSRRVVGLCSDSLSEGVNLQQAAALVHMDMPSVVRIAEQRAGRIDRLDSPHSVVRAYWPGDAEEFRLSSDERFIERHETVDALLGTNLVLPHGMREASSSISTEEILKEFEEQANAGAWDGLQDAFEPVRSLVSGSSSLVAEDVYDHYRDVEAKVLTRVSLVNSESSWAFFCLAGGEFGAPRWVFLPSLQGEPQSELESIAEELRRRLTKETRSVKPDESVMSLVDSFLGQLSRAERVLLPQRKQRALEELEAVIGELIQRNRSRRHQQMMDRLLQLQRAIFQPEFHTPPDLEEIASRWMDLVRPTWYRRLKSPRQRPLLLRDIRPFLLEREDELCPQLLRAFERIPILQRPDERIAACIVGVP